MSADDMGIIVVWALQQDPPVAAAVFTEGQGFPCTCVAVSGDVIVAGFSTGTLRIYRLSALELHMEVAAHSRCITALSVHPSATMMATVSEDTFLHIWPLPSFDSKDVDEVRGTRRNP